MLKLMLMVSTLFFITPSLTFSQADLLKSSTFKVTIISGGEEMEWEYENPDDFEFEKGNTVMKGERAKKEVIELFHSLDLKIDTDVQDIKQVLEKKGYKEMDQFIIRLKNFDEQLYVWKWEKQG